MAPPSQKTRPISFTLETPTGFPSRFTFSIRPEDLTVAEPSRLEVQQTLGGAWADVFDRGISTISLSGHNGWRGSFLFSGEDLLLNLRDTVFANWHAGRAKALKNGQDPSKVRLYFTDDLDSISQCVVPRSFQIRRSRSSPLLIRYQIQLVVIGGADDPLGLIDTIINALSNPTRFLLGITGLTNIAMMIQTGIQTVVAVAGALGGVVSAFLGTGQLLMSTISSAAQQLQGAFTGSSSSLLSIGGSYATAGANAFNALAADDSLASDLRFPLMQTAALFNDAACTINNSFSTERIYRTVDPLFGASACSSTGGGDPWNAYTLAGSNPFDDIMPSGEAPVTATADAQAALAELSGDVLALAGRNALIGSLLARVAAGINVT